MKFEKETLNKNKKNFFISFAKFIFT